MGLHRWVCLILISVPSHDNQTLSAHTPLHTKLTDVLLT